MLFFFLIPLFSLHSLQTSPPSPTQVMKIISIVFIQILLTPHFVVFHFATEVCTQQADLLFSVVWFKSVWAFFLSEEFSLHVWFSCSCDTALCYAVMVCGQSFLFLAVHLMGTFFFSNIFTYFFNLLCGVVLYSVQHLRICIKVVQHSVHECEFWCRMTCRRNY